MTFGLPSLTTIGIVGVALAGAFTAGAVASASWNRVGALKAEIATLQFDAGEAARKGKEADANQADIDAADATNQEKIRAAETILARSYGCPTPSELAWLRQVGAGAATKPPEPARLGEAGRSAEAEGCDPWPIIAVHERAGRLKANDVIARLRHWYGGLVTDYAAGRASK